MFSLNTAAVGSGSVLHLIAGMMMPRAPVVARANPLNDCGFRALRLDRTAAIERVILRIQLGDRTIIRMIRFEVIAETGNPMPTRTDLIDYLRGHYLNRQGMLWYHPDGVGTLVALAHIFGIELRIFMDQNDGTARRVLLYTPEHRTDEIINLLHTHHHFELLEIPLENPRNLVGQLAQITRWRAPVPETIVIERSLRRRLYFQDSEHYLLPNFVHETRPRLTLVLDLDETLIFNRRGAPVLRPHIFHLLERLQALDIEIVIWTASSEATARRALQETGVREELFDNFIFRDGRWYNEHNHLKDLRLLGRDMNRVMIVDNSAHVCRTNPRNAVLVEDFVGNLNIDDDTLINILHIVEYAYQEVSDQNTIPRIIEFCKTIKAWQYK
ncbi:MAG: HAD family hydrolase [Myxococcaceae bacterium]